VPDIGIVVNPVVLKVVVVIDGEYLCALFGERATDDRPGDRVGEAQHPCVPERPVRGPERFRFALADLPDRDHRLLRQIESLRVGEPFLR
jgi:hypothetical protein